MKKPVVLIVVLTLTVSIVAILATRSRIMEAVATQNPGHETGCCSESCDDSE